MTLSIFLTLLAIGSAAVIFAVLERVPSLQRLRLPLFRSFFAADILFLVLGFLVGGRLVLDYLSAANGALDAIALPRLSSLDLPLWASTAIALVLLDIGLYASHLLLHHFDRLWTFHQVHHSVRALDWLATFHSHLGEQLFRRLIAPLLLILAGVPATGVAIASAFVLFWGIFNHSNLSLNLRFLEPLFITPRLHHLHHVATSDGRNLGTVFSLWDRLLGRLDTREVPPEEELGLAGEIETYPQGFLRPLAEPFRRWSDSRRIALTNLHRGRA
jgi:sterol desaturase/sphingolipid hydroxylase (fatty acid hydroxylase superfamily)